MKPLCNAIFAATLLLPLSVFANMLVIAADGSGATKTAAVDAAKHQVTVDAHSAGFSPQNGYRIGAMRIAKVTRDGSVYFAHINADLIRVTETKRVAFLISGDDGEASRLLSVVQRMRTLMKGSRASNRANIEILDVRATGNLRLTNPDDLQRPEMSAELAHTSQTHGVSVIYLLAEADEPDTSLLVTYQTGRDGFSIRTMRLGGDADIAAARLTQFVDVIRQDVGSTASSLDKGSVLTSATPSAVVRKGQRVVIYEGTTGGEAGRDFAIVARGVVTEASGSRLRVETQKPVATDSKTKNQQRTLPKRALVITEADW